MVGQMLGLFKSLDLGLKPDEPSAPISSGRITLLAGVGLPSTSAFRGCGPRSVDDQREKAGNGVGITVRGSWRSGKGLDIHYKQYIMEVRHTLHVDVWPRDWQALKESGEVGWGVRLFRIGPRASGRSSTI